MFEVVHHLADQHRPTGFPQSVHDRGLEVTELPHPYLLNVIAGPSWNTH
jgi:hypothetical protein